MDEALKKILETIKKKKKILTDLETDVRKLIVRAQTHLPKTAPKIPKKIKRRSKKSKSKKESYYWRKKKEKEKAAQAEAEAAKLSRPANAKK